jgi:hypothetical protein
MNCVSSVKKNKKRGRRGRGYPHLEVARKLSGRDLHHGLEERKKTKSEISFPSSISVLIDRSHLDLKFCFIFQRSRKLFIHDVFCNLSFIPRSIG